MVPGGVGGALHGITQLLGQVVKLAAKNPIFLLKKPRVKSFLKKTQELSPLLRTKYFLKRVCAVFMLAACYLALTTELLHEELHHHQEPFTSILGFMLMLAKNPFRTI